jgi:hypothetical protein
LDEEKMNNEFKKIVSDKVTRYVLEDGATVTTGAVATVEKPLGELQRRVDTPPPRNFVAKNAKMGGAGKMKDKSKTIPRKEKHKKPVAEGSMDELEQRRKLINYISQKKGWDVSDLELARTSELILMYKKIKEKDVSENNHPDEKEDQALIRKMVKRDALKKEGYGMNGYATAIGSRPRPGNVAGVSENDDDVGQEIGMASSELYGIAKHAKELLGLINQQGQEQGLEAWQQSKITKAADYLTSVLQNMDYDTQSVSEGSGANKTYLAMAYLKAVVMAPMGTPEKRRILNWQQILSNQFDIEMDPATLAQLLPQFDSQLKSGQLDKLQNRMASRGELEIGESEQGVAEAFGPLPRDSQQIRLGRHTVDIERVGEDKNYIGFAWHDSKGQDHYEEVSVGDLGSYDDLIDRIKQEISYQERQYTDQGVAEAEKKGLYYYVNKRKKAGTSRDASSPKAPTAQAWKDAAKTAKKEDTEKDDAYMMELANKLAEKIPKGADVGYYIKDFAKSTAPQFKNKPPAKRRQMAIAAWQDSKKRK